MYGRILEFFYMQQHRKKYVENKKKYINDIRFLKQK